jgi:hypothetical protein
MYTFMLIHSAKKETHKESRCRTVLAARSGNTRTNFNVTGSVLNCDFFFTYPQKYGLLIVQ